MSEIVSNTDLKWVFCRSKKNKRGEKKNMERKKKRNGVGSHDRSGTQRSGRSGGNPSLGF